MRASGDAIFHREFSFSLFWDFFGIYDRNSLSRFSVAPWVINSNFNFVQTTLAKSTYLSFDIIVLNSSGVLINFKISLSKDLI